MHNTVVMQKQKKRLLYRQVIDDTTVLLKYLIEGYSFGSKSSIESISIYSGTTKPF